MTKLTWRGPDDYEAGETPPSSCTWNGITFPVGVAVEVDNPTMIAKARGNRMFKVEDEPPDGAMARARHRGRPEPDVSFFDDPPVSDFTDDAARRRSTCRPTTRRKKNPSASPGARATR